ncbi:MAG: RusA family crossover junction endodeoxyribonuclease [Planctomycetota bacterium]|jgi:Holliday junction resolvase RusA-like endonuclease
MIAFEVLGVPRPQGSKRAFIRGGRAVLVEDSKRSRPWRKLVAAAAKKAAEREGVAYGKGVPLRVDVWFTFERPKSHFTSKGALRKGVSKFHVQKPDRDKLLRCVCDALTQSGVIYDDCQIVEGDTVKEWSPVDSCIIWVREVKEGMSCDDLL